MSALGGVAVLCLILIGYLTFEVAGKLRELETSRTDNVHFTMSQLEVEFLELALALDTAQAAPDADRLRDLRRRFGVAYSRVATLRASPYYRETIGAKDGGNALAELRADLDGMIPAIDGSDAQLAAALPDLAAQLTGLRSDVRIIALRGNRALTVRTEAARTDVAWVLQQLALASVVLVGVLIWLMLSFWRLYKVNQRRARETRETSARLSTIIATSQDAILVLDAAGEISGFNGAARCIFGRTAEDAAAAGLSGLLCNGENNENPPSPVTAADLRAACADGPRSGWRLTGCAADRRRFPVELSLDTASQGEETITVCFIRDISLRVQAEQDMAHARDMALASERTKARFMAVMSHEMRTPLNGILGAIDLLEAGGARPAQRPYLEVMQNSGQQLLQHVNDVLDITQIEAAGVSLTTADFDLDQLIDDLIRTEHPKATARGTTLAREPGDAPVGRVHGDAGRVHQILLNLVTNAIKFTDRGQVMIEASRISTGGAAGGSLVEIRVSDNGIGIAEDQLQRIFDDFVRLDQAVIGRTEGTGLGLGIVQRLVEAMGGKIEVDSIEGEGSLFSLRLPLEPAPEATLPVSAAQNTALKADAGRPQTILIVEDNPTNRFITREMLRRDGHRVDEAENGEIGVQMAARRRYDLILMDISMPVMDGLEATGRIRASSGASAHSVIIALTAHIYSGNASDLTQAGFSSVMTKPVRWQALREVLARDAAPADTPPAPLPRRREDTIDSAVVADLLETLPGEQGRTLIAAFLAEGDTFLATLPDMQHLPLPELEARLHAFAGSAATFGAAGMHRALARAERAAQGRDRPGALSELQGLDGIWAQTQTAFLAQGAGV